jgi:hypothetical protein
METAVAFMDHTVLGFAGAMVPQSAALVWLVRP